mmetsp:Transcript_104307/g.271552  ORF Transcript_104307/g.271552 Transcript_104307/m.271552 type:complete len:138 (+) Transcript_104307:76-489(+)
MALRRVLLLVAAVTPLAAMAAVPLQECDSTDTCAPFEEADSAAMLQTKSLASQEQASTYKIPTPADAPQRNPSRPGCCQASTATCYACQADTTVAVWCAYNPSTQFCPTKVKEDESSPWTLPGIGDLSRFNPLGQYR